MEKHSVLKDSLGRFLRDLFDLMILNWLWLLCSLPVITVGPATCGLYTATLKMARDESVQPVKDFFRGFRGNFKTGTVLGLAAIILLAVAAGDAVFALTQTGFGRTLYLVIAVVIAAVLMTLLSDSFALLAMFDSPLKVQLQNTVKLAFVTPGRTIGLWIILLLPVILLLILPPVVLGMLGFVYVLLGISGPVYIASRILRNIFDYVNGGPVVEQAVPEE